MKPLQVAARVNKAGVLELAEPLPEEFRARDVDIIVVDRSGANFDVWQLLGIRAFFADEDAADSIYDSVE